MVIFSKSIERSQSENNVAGFTPFNNNSNFLECKISPENIDNPKHIEIHYIVTVSINGNIEERQVRLVSWVKESAMMSAARVYQFLRQKGFQPSTLKIVGDAEDYSFAIV